jgi:hypothetical protein
MIAVISQALLWTLYRVLDRKCKTKVEMTFVYRVVQLVSVYCRWILDLKRGRVEVEGCKNGLPIARLLQKWVDSLSLC